MMKRNRARSIRTIAPLVFLLAAACQATTRADVAQAPPAAAADAGHRHTPGMVMDTVRSAPGAAAGGASAMRMDPDTRFIHHMTMHHAQALVMTDLVESRNASRGLSLLAERITLSQRDEIARMRSWLERRGKPLPPEGEHAMHMVMPGMLTEAELARLAGATGSEFERLFLELMIKHHQGALLMVAELLGSQGAAQDPELFAMVNDIDADQTAEIARMRSMLGALGASQPR